MDVATVDRDVTGQFAEKGNPQPEAKEESNHQNEAPNDNEELADLGHKSIVPVAERPDLAAGSQVG